VRSEKLSAKFWRIFGKQTRLWMSVSRARFLKARRISDLCSRECRAIKVTDLVRRFDVITVEDLKIRGMIWNRCFAQAICVWLGGLFHDDEGQS
jgi:hypothetical protein